jgi:hypothetical protein
MPVVFFSMNMFVLQSLPERRVWIILLDGCAHAANFRSPPMVLVGTNGPKMALMQIIANRRFERRVVNAARCTGVCYRGCAKNLPELVRF